ncbi:hypothetical protein GCM10027447_01990 [Glycomyces halotolerans]
MPTTSKNKIHVDDLHAWARGDLRMMAAVRLLDDSDLIAHTWVDQFINTDPWLHIDFETMRRKLRRSPLSTGEQAIAEAALSLAGHLDADLGSIAITLDHTQLEHLQAAIALAGGNGSR